MAPYLTPSAAKARAPRLTEFEDDDIARSVASFEEIAESYRGVAYTPRTLVEGVMLTNCTSELVLTRTRIRTVSSVTIDGTDPGGWVVDRRSGILRRRSGWPTDVEILITVEHGHDAPSSVLLDATCEYICHNLTAQVSGTSRDVVAQGLEGSWTRYSTPDAAQGRPTGWTEPDRLLNSLVDERVGFA